MPSAADVEDLIRRAGVTADSTQNIDLDTLASESFDEISDYGEDDLSQVEQLSSMSFGSDSSNTGPTTSNAHKMELEVLRMDLKSKNDELDSVRQQARKTISELQNRLLSVERRASEAQSKLELDLARHKTEMAEAAKSHAQELAKLLHSRKDQIELDTKLANDKSAALRRSFLPLELSVERHTALKDIPAEELPLQGWIQIEVHEHVSRVHTQLESVRRDRDTFKEDLASATSELQQMKRELSQSEEVVKSREQELANLAASTTEQINSLRLTASEAEGKFQTVADQGKTYKDTRAKLERLETQHLEVTKDRDAAVSKYDALQTAASNAAATQQQMELLKMDKSYLERENDTLKQRVSRSEESSDTANRAVEGLKEEKQQLYDRLLSIQSDHAAGMNHKVEEELTRLRQQSDLDLLAAQRNAKEMYERENVSLKEARDSARNDAERQSANLKHAQEVATQLEVDYRSLQATADMQITDIRARLKMKSFEHERLAIQMEEIKSDLTQIKLENAKWSKKFEVLKEEYYTLKGDSANRITELSSRLTTTSQSLEHYELIESELDAAVCPSAAHRSTTTALLVQSPYDSCAGGRARPSADRMGATRRY
jgi:chromosome segregation ATPase